MGSNPFAQPSAPGPQVSTMTFLNEDNSAAAVNRLAGHRKLMPQKAKHFRRLELLVDISNFRACGLSLPSVKLTKFDYWRAHQLYPSTPFQEEATNDRHDLLSCSQIGRKGERA